MKRSLNLVVLILIALSTFGQYDSTITFVYFESDQSSIGQQEQEKLQHFVNQLDTSRLSKIIIRGHTDGDGSNAYNIKLSEARTQTVSNVLQQHKLSKNMLKCSNYGENRPASDNSTEEGKQRNRRVEIIAICNTPPGSEHRTTSIHDLYEQVSPQKQKFYMDASKEDSKRCDQGTIIRTFPGSFLRNGKPLTQGRVKITIQEVYGKTDMLLSNLNTNSHDEILQTEGMLYFNAEYLGEQLEINPEKRPQIMVPTDNYNEESQIFNGSNTGPDSSINWTVEEMDIPTYASPMDLVNCNYGGWTDQASVFGSSDGNYCPFFICGLSNLINYLGNKAVSFIEWSLPPYGQQANPAFVSDTSTMMATNQNTERINFDICRNSWKHKDDRRLRLTNPSLYNFYLPLFEKYKVRTIGELYSILQQQRDSTIEKNLANGSKINYSDMSYYMFNRSNLGWVNVDYFTSYPSSQLATISINEKPAKTTQIKLVFISEDIVLTAKNNGKNYKFIKVPKNKDIWVVGLKYENMQPYVAFQKLNINKNYRIRNLSFEKVDIKELKQKLEMLNLS